MEGDRVPCEVDGPWNMFCSETAKKPTAPHYGKANTLKFGKEDPEQVRLSSAIPKISNLDRRAMSPDYGTDNCCFEDPVACYFERMIAIRISHAGEGG